MPVKKITKIILLLILIAIAFYAGGCGVAGSGARDLPIDEKEALTDEDPVASPKQEKEDPLPSEADKKSEAVCTCTFSITCKSILDKLSDNEDFEIVSPDGIIYPEKQVEFKPGESAFDLLLKETRQNGIHMEFNKNPVYNSCYVEGIGNIYEFDFGPLSGWTYKINGETLGYGSSSHKLCDGDVLEWLYTCDQGRDLDGDTYREGELN